MPDPPDAPLDILLIEDNPGDVRLVREALFEAGVAGSLRVVSDGETAESALAAIAASGNLPDAVLLDLDLPRVSGQQLLTSIRSNPSLRDLLVVVLTSSAADEDVQGSLELEADYFVTKPIDLEPYLALAARLADVARRKPRRRHG